jgi:4-hydroxybenzoate polyprenyltransferase
VFHPGNVLAGQTPGSFLRALLVLGRVSNLPTVWSNCLAGWLLGGDGDWPALGWLCLGASLVYLGGMYLNDAFDAEWDRRFRPERPIPSGTVRAPVVWALGWLWLLGGGALLAGQSGAPLSLVMLLAVCVVAYDVAHKAVSFAPLLMAACRFLLYVIAASSGGFGVTGIAVWGGVVMAAYIAGLSCLARVESTESVFARAPLVLLAAPLVLALVVNDQEYRVSGLVLCFAVGAWMLMSLRHAFNRPVPNVGRAVGDLLAGIPLVDLLAVGGVSPELAAGFLGCFALAWLAQRVVPAT